MHAVVTSFLALSMHMQRVAVMSSCRQLAPRKEVLQSSSQEYMRSIKAKHHEEEVNRRDRKARRRQALAQLQNRLQVHACAHTVLCNLSKLYDFCLC